MVFFNFFENLIQLRLPLSGRKKSVSTAAIIGIAVGGIIILGILFLALWRFRGKLKGNFMHSMNIIGVMDIAHKFTTF